MLLAAKLLMATGVDLFLDEVLIKAAQEEFKNRLGNREYRTLIPIEAPPPLEINRQTMEKYRGLMEEKARKK